MTIYENTIQRVGPYPDPETEVIEKATKACIDELQTDLTAAQGTIDEIETELSLVNNIRDCLKGDYLVSKPGLTIGTSADTDIKIANDFLFQINGVQQAAVSAAEVAPDAGTELDNSGGEEILYWACRLQVGTNGTVDFVEAADNGTGYASAELALAGLPDLADDHASVGTVTIAVDATATFTPGTTGLDASGITATYADGDTVFEAIGGDDEFGDDGGIG